jgi:hypothetical protein
MPLISAVNADNRSIPSGSPVAGKSNRFQLDRVILAGGSVLAAGIVKSGSITGGVINIQTDGIVDLDDWTLSTGTRFLSEGKTYRLSNTSGKLTTSGTGQVIGLAVSQKQLSLQIGSGVGSSSTGSDASGSSPGETAARINGDNVLTTQIAAEANARTSADTLLQTEIDAIQISYASIAKFGEF